MLYKSITSEIFFGIFPTALAIQLITFLITFSDTVIIGHYLGDNALAALTLVMPLFMLLTALMEIISLGGCNAFSTEIGKGHKKEAGAYFSLAMLLAFGGGLLLSALGFIFLNPLVAILGPDEEILSMTKNITTSLLYAMPFLLTSTVMEFFIRNDGKSRQVIIADTVFILSNFILAVYFVGYTKLEVSGIFLAIGSAGLIEMIILSRVLFSKQTALKFNRHFSLAHLIRIFHSSNLSFKHIFKGLSMLFFNNLIMGCYGNDSVVAYTMIINSIVLATAISGSLRDTTQPLIATYYGENNSAGIRETLDHAKHCGIFFTIILVVALELFPASGLKLLGIYEPAMVNETLTGLHIFALCMPFLIFNEVMNYYYQFIDHIKLSFFIIASKGLVLLLPLGFLGHLYFGLNGIWYGFILTEALTIVFLVIMAKKKAISQNVSGFLLLPKTEMGKYFTYVITNINDSLNNCINLLEKFLDKQPLPQDILSKKEAAILGSIRELAEEITTFNPNKKNLVVEINLTLVNNSFNLLLRDNGQLYSSLKKISADTLQNSEDNLILYGFHLSYVVPNKVKYVPALGYNRVSIEI